MEFIAHRINTVAQLAMLNPSYGIELDLRDNLNGDIYISHDPFEDGENFENYLKEYHHGTMILNIKSERIEHTILELLNKYSVTKYFFLDSTFPMIKLLSDNGEKNLALRYSEFEGMDTLESMAGKVSWVWVDCFTKMPLDYEKFVALKQMEYKLCFVSPELQGQPEKIELYQRQIAQEKIVFDAICTKTYNISNWEL